MARGNLVSVKCVRYILGLYVIESMSGSFKDYEHIYLSKAGMVIGTWGSKFGKPYKDYLRRVPKGAQIVQIKDDYIVLK